jgi:hypothetical protein
MITIDQTEKGNRVSVDVDDPNLGKFTLYASWVILNGHVFIGEPHIAGLAPLGRYGEGRRGLIESDLVAFREKLEEALCRGLAELSQKVGP